MRKSVYILFLSLLAVGVLSCDDYDKWTTSPSARLSFSADTVSFDTVITTLSSPTQQLLVWNNGDEGLRIKSVALQSGSQSLFRVNVDGQYLYDGRGEDYEVRRKDSIFVKVEVKLPEGKTDSVLHYEDRLNFTLESGTMQSVVLQADGQNVRILKGKSVTKDTTLTAGLPFLVYDSLVVQKGAKLTIEPGVKLLFHDDVNLTVKGTLKAEGTLEKPITFRGDRLDRLFSYLPYDNTTNRWGGIVFKGTSTGNVMTQCDVHSGTFGIRCDSAVVYDKDTPNLRLTNSIIHNVGGVGLSSTSNCVEVIGTQISNTLNQTVYVLGGSVRFVHCTIAQFYPFSADRGDALYLANKTDQEFYPLDRAEFLNCVITGYADDVIMGNLQDEQDTPCPYLFANCLLRTVETVDAERFVNITYDNEDLKPNGSGHFVLFDTDNFLYDFTPTDSSAIRGKADIEYTKKYSPVDRRGVNRLADGLPDLGAYQYVEKKEEKES